MARFSIKDLMWSTLLVAVGICMLIPLFRVAPENSPLRSFGLAGILDLWVGGLAMLVAGLLAPFHRVKLGFMLGAGLAIVLGLIVIATLPQVY